MIKAFALAFRKCLKLTPNPTPFPLTWLCYAWALVHVREYVQTICALILNTHVAPSNETTGVLHLLHPLVEVDLPLFVDDFHLEMKVILNQETFISTLVCSPRLSSNGSSGMVYELLRDCFVLEDYANGFKFFFKVCGHIVQGHVPPLVPHLFFAFQFLTLEKQSGSMRSITISEVTYHLVAHIIAI